MPLDESCTRRGMSDSVLMAAVVGASSVAGGCQAEPHC